MSVIIPPKLKRGDTIGVIAPSHFISDVKTKIEEGGKLLEKLGYKLLYGKNIDKKFYEASGTPEERVADLHEMIKNKNVKAIICAMGGDSTNQILDLIDYSLIQNNPKIIMGMSDITHLLLAIHSQTSLVTFHGQCLWKFKDMTKSSFSFLNSLFTGGNLFNYPSEMEILKPGKISGSLIGGNLLVINALLASKYRPNFKNAILFWEDIDENLTALGYQLNQLKLSGVLNDIAGMMIGHIDKEKKGNRPVQEIVLELMKSNKIPIVKVEYFGHQVNNFYTMPIGIRAVLDTSCKELKLLEHTVF